MDIKEIMSENMRRLRKGTGKSQDSFAQSVGVPFRTYQNIEGGNSWPEYDNLLAIAGGLDVKPENIFGDELDRLALIADLASLDKTQFALIYGQLRSALDTVTASAASARHNKNNSG